MRAAAGEAESEEYGGGHAGAGVQSGEHLERQSHSGNNLTLSNRNPDDFDQKQEETSFTSTNVNKLRILWRFDPSLDYHLTVT